LPKEKGGRTSQGQFDLKKGQRKGLRQATKRKSAKRGLRHRRGNNEKPKKAIDPPKHIHIASLEVGAKSWKKTTKQQKEASFWRGKE